MPDTTVIMRRLKSAERGTAPEKATTAKACPACAYGLHSETPILEGFVQVGSVCRCARCGHEWQQWRHESRRLAHLAAMKKDTDHG